MAWFCTRLRGCLTPQINLGGIHGFPLSSSSTDWTAATAAGLALGVASVQASWAETCSFTVLLARVRPPRSTMAVDPVCAALMNEVPVGKVPAAFCSRALWG